MTQPMSDDDVREFVTELLRLSPTEQARELKELTDDEKGRILVSFPPEERDSS